MRINLETDYAIRIVDCLAKSGGRMDARTIAERTRVTPRVSLKVLRQLVSAGIVTSFKGVGGGYELCREPQDITLRAVIEAMEGPIVISKCQQENYVCDHSDCSCYFYRMFSDISKELAERFDKVHFGPRD